MYTFLRAFSDVLFELKCIFFPMNASDFDIEKNLYRLYMHTSAEKCDCVVYCSNVFGKDIKQAIFANKKIDNEGLMSLMRLAKRVEDEYIDTDKKFITDELVKVVKHYNGSTIEAVGEAIIRGISYDEYVNRMGKCPKNVNPDIMWIITHQVLNNIDKDVFKKSVYKKVGYVETVNSYLLETKGIDTDAVNKFCLENEYSYDKDKIKQNDSANVMLRALNNGIDLSVFTKEKRLIKTFFRCNPSDFNLTIGLVIAGVGFKEMSYEVFNDNMYANVLTALYHARLSGVNESTLIKYLRDREKLSNKTFIDNLVNDMHLLEQGVIL